MRSTWLDPIPLMVVNYRVNRTKSRENREQVTIGKGGLVLS